MQANPGGSRSSGSRAATYYGGTVYFTHLWAPAAWSRGETIYPSFQVQNTKPITVQVKVSFIVADGGVYEVIATKTVVIPPYGTVWGMWSVHTRMDTTVGLKEVIGLIEDAVWGFQYQKYSFGNYYIQTFNQGELQGWTPESINPLGFDDMVHRDSASRLLAATWADNSMDVATAAQKLTVQVCLHFVYFGIGIWVAQTALTPTY